MLPKAVELLKDLFSEQELEIMYRRPSEHPPEMKQQNDELAQWVNGMEEARIAEELFQRRTPLVPEDAFYVSQALGNAILGWGTGRYVIDAGTGAGKTAA